MDSVKYTTYVLFMRRSYMFRLHQRGCNQAVQDCEKVIIDIKFWAISLPYIKSYWYWRMCFYVCRRD